MNGWRLIGFGLLLAGCATQPVSTPPPVKLPAATPDAREDERIGREVRRRLSALGPESVGIAIEVNGGAVTLRGTVPSVMAAWRVEAAARAVAGVTGIRNELRARETPSGY